MELERGVDDELPAEVTLFMFHFDNLSIVLLVNSPYSHHI